MQLRPCITPQLSRKAGNSIGGNRDGADFVRCRICGEHRRVLSDRHFAKHGTDRETYMAEYRLTPDALCAQDFRRLVSSRPRYYPHRKRDWIAAIKKIMKCERQVFAGYIQHNHRHVYDQGVWIFGDWDKALRAAGFGSDSMRKRRLWDKEAVIREIRCMQRRKLPLYAHWVIKNHTSLLSAALHQYGSWSNALIAAGIDAQSGRTAVVRACCEHCAMPWSGTR